MNTISPLSFSSAYAARANSVYGSTKVSAVKDEQESSAAQTSSTDLSSRGEIKDEAIVSDEAKTLLEKDKTSTSENNGSKETSFQIKKELTPEQEQVVAKFKLRDAEVKTHEQAHIGAASGINASAPTFDYQTGPDGKQYAVGGEVSISFSQSENPAENLAKAEAMRAAALAPAEPSNQDLSVANKAEKMIQEAKQKLAEQKAETVPTENKADETNKQASDEKSAESTASPQEV